MLQFRESFAPITTEDVDLLEARLRISLPEHYKRFLLQINGGWPKPNAFHIRAAQAWGTADFLYGIAGKDVSGDLESEQEEHRERGSVESGMLVIGHDPGGNLLILDTEGKRRGVVYYWDASYLYAASNEQEGNTYIIAPTFQGFLDGLQPSE